MIESLKGTNNVYKKYYLGACTFLFYTYNIKIIKYTINSKFYPMNFYFYFLIRLVIEF